jgi:nitrite reductase/ring-hydroxylating ferredoxin subunit/uncharacterized membrane protein
VGVSAVIERIEEARRLDKLAEPLANGMRRALGGRAVKDALNGVWFGHPLHPALVQLPLGAWSAAALLDLGPAGNEPAATKLVAAGLAAAVPAASAGWADWVDLHPQQLRVGLVHAATNLAAVGCYAVSLQHRLAGHRLRGRLFGFAGLAIASAGGYLGGHLAYRQAAGSNHAEHVPHLTPTGWIDLGPLEELPDGEPVERLVGRVPLFVFRRGGQVWALGDTCSHLSAPLHQGTVRDEPELCIECPWHRSTFRLFDGSVVHGPATAPVPALQVQVLGGRVSVQLEGAG